MFLPLVCFFRGLLFYLLIFSMERRFFFVQCSVWLQTKSCTANSWNCANEVPYVGVTHCAAMVVHLIKGLKTPPYGWSIMESIPISKSARINQSGQFGIHNCFTVVGLLILSCLLITASVCIKFNMYKFSLPLLFVQKREENN